MDWLWDALKNHRFQGLFAGLLIGAAISLFVAGYEIKSFKALGFEFVFPETATSNNPTLRNKLTRQGEQIAEKDQKIAELEQAIASGSEANPSATAEALRSEFEKRTAELTEQQANDIGELRRQNEIAVKDLSAEVSQAKGRLATARKDIGIRDRAISKLRKQLTAQGDKKSAEELLSLKTENKKLREKIKSLSSTKNKNKTDKCASADPEHEGTFRINRDVTWRGFDGNLRLRIRSIDRSEVGVKFTSNYSAINEVYLGIKRQIEYMFDDCTYYIEIFSMDAIYGFVTIKVFKL